MKLYVEFLDQKFGARWDNRVYDYFAIRLATFIQTRISKFVLQITLLRLQISYKTCSLIFIFS